MNDQITVGFLLAEEARLLGERRRALLGDAQPEMQMLRVGLSESGQRFRKLAGTLQKRGDIRNPNALAAWIGRKKYGKDKFQKMARHESGSLLDRIAASELSERVDYTADWASDFGARLKKALETAGDVGDIDVVQGGNVNAYVRGTFNGKKFEIEIRAKSKYQRANSPRFISALKINGEWMPGSSIKKVVAALGG